jgi:uncharacterized metal-binding protein
MHYLINFIYNEIGAMCEKYNIVVKILFDEYIHKKWETELNVLEVQTLKQRNNYMSWKWSQVIIMAMGHHLRDIVTSYIKTRKKEKEKWHHIRKERF